MVAQLKSAYRPEDKRAREKPEQERHDFDAEAGQHGTLVGHQAGITTVTRTPCGASSARIASVNDIT